MTRRTAVLAAFLMTAPLIAAAHEGHEHKVMGTVTAVHADRNQVEIKTAGGEPSSFRVAASTKFLKGASAATLEALTPGTRVVAEGKMVDGVVLATTVRIGNAAPAATRAPAAAPRHQH